MLLSVLPDHTLELHHGVQHVLGFQQMTAGSKVLALNDDPIPSFTPLSTQPFTMSFEDGHQNHLRTVSMLSVTSTFYATKRDLWHRVLDSGLSLWPTLADVTAVHYKNLDTGYQVTLNYFREDVMSAFFQHWGHPYFPNNHMAVAQYLNRATAQLPHDPQQFNFPWTALTDESGRSVLSLAVQGCVSLTFSAGMAKFVDYRGPLQFTVGTVDQSDKVFYKRWHYDKPDRQTPCNVIPLRGSKDRYLLQGESGYTNFSQSLREVLTFLPARMEDSVAKIVTAFDLDTPLRQPSLLSTVALEHCHVEVDLVAPGFCKDKYRRVLATLPFDTEKHYGHTVGVDLPHSQYVPLAAPLRNVGEIRVHLRNDDDESVPFYTGIVILQLHFRRSRSASS